ncbi:vomeronasal type-2 receptor 26-like [Protopterus annectens]|uniref:vomeronasal type-2 receptor 26-like n=1 Tax=Protopterus annectens TaxID=7888 RepID=UPI001CFBB9CB|nr:vomeronasal type-2 receptor 26-like [Protopterus annectens]
MAYTKTNKVRLVSTRMHQKNAPGDEISLVQENLDIILSYNYILFENQYYVQKKGVAMGSPCGSSYPIMSRCYVDRSNFVLQVPKSVCSELCAIGFRKAAQVGQPACCFDCVPCSKGEISNKTDASNCIICPEELWSNEKRDKCVPKIIDYLSFNDPLGSILTILASAFSLISASFLCIFVKFQDSPIVKANNRELSYLLLCGLILCFICPIIFIGKPQYLSCILRQTAFGVIFSICVSSLQAKTVIVVIAFKATRPTSTLRLWVGSRWIPYSIVTFSAITQLIICVVWIAVATPFPQKNINSELGKIIFECNEGSTVMLYCMLCYLGLLATVCFIIAFLAKNLPDSFNEAKHITFSMVVFISVWLSFIPAYVSTRGKYVVVVEIFTILASSAGLLFCIFIPKMYIILLRPDLNTREKLTGK